LPIFRFSRAFGVRRDAKAFLNMQGGLTRGVVPNPRQHQERAEKLRRVVGRQKKALRRKDRQIAKKAAKIEEQAAKIEEQAAKIGEQAAKIGEQTAEIAYLREERRRERKQARGLKQKRLEIFHLRNELEATKDLLEKARDDPSAARVSDEPEVGSLPDFVIIGAQKCGTTAFYSLLTDHPNVEPAGVRELHYFDRTDRFEKGAEWYRRCFPPPRWKNGCRSITGEKTPYYLFHPHVPARMAEVVPQVRLIVLLRNPVDRAYSQYHHDTPAVRRSNTPASRTFEEAIEQQDSSYLSRGIYVDQLLRWSEYFSREQMLVLKSEDFFEHTAETSRQVQDYLDLPYQRLDLPPRETADRYEPMNPETRLRLETYFESHNQRLYDYLGVDLGW
jgi:hypothetical protein